MRVIKIKLICEWYEYTTITDWQKVYQTVMKTSLSKLEPLSQEINSSWAVEGKDFIKILKKDSSIKHHSA